MCKTCHKPTHIQKSMENSKKAGIWQVVVDIRILQQLRRLDSEVHVVIQREKL